VAQLIIFSISIITFSVNLYFLGLLWFADKRDDQVKSLIAMGIATCYWTIFDAIAGVAQEYTYAYMYTLRSIMLVIAPICFLTYMFWLNNFRIVRGKGSLFIWVFPIVDIILLLTNPFHRLVFSKDGFPLPEYGPLFAYHAAVAYAAIALGVILLLRFIVRERPPAVLTVCWLAACFIPIVVNVLFTVGAIQMNQDIAPFGFAAIFILCAFYFHRTRLSNLKASALDDAFNAYQEAIVLSGQDGIVEDVNASFEAYFPDCAVVPRKTETREILEYFEGKAADAATAAAFRRLADGGATKEKSEFSFRTGAGQAKTFSVSKADVVGRGGQLSGRMLSLSDVSDYRNMIQEIHEQNERLSELREKAEAASNAKSVFLANMSHEMRTPLNAIIGLSELVLRRKLDKDTQSSIEKVHASGRNLLSVINDILDISKIESGRFELVPVEYATADMINAATAQNRVRIGEKPIRFILDVDAGLPQKLVGDELRVRQIMSNFLSNAIKYTKDGEVGLSVSCEEKDGAVRLRISVCDTGMGIRAEEMPDIFKEYHQADMKSNRKVEGTGLGLAITRQLTERMGGSIEVQSEYGKGSVFTAAVVQEVADWAPIGAQTAAALEGFRYTAERREEDTEMAYTPMPYGRVLVVDDVDINLEVAKGMLEPYGLTVDTVMGGVEAIELVRAGEPSYDLIFMDQMMPGMDGIETVRRIREDVATDYALAVPIIALTANAMVGSSEIFLQNGFQGFLAKPIDLREMNEVLVRWVVGREC
jgi:signal transduction histidine kinase/ActR/RegA family two-component response regulator